MRLLALALVIFGAAFSTTHAAEFPERPVKIIVPYQPGGLLDVTARLIAQKLRDKWKQPIIVENRPGASGTIGIRVAAQSDPDGYTWLITSSAEFTINPALLREVPYDLDRVFNAITM
ncbi:MAG: hypothetical protein JWQ00_455, partial [Noviherbaspirillum sp.]|nr:hypothetical protein [Noviherbaspirillum sp.]